MKTRLFLLSLLFFTTSVASASVLQLSQGDGLTSFGMHYQYQKCIGHFHCISHDFSAGPIDKAGIPIAISVFNEMKIKPHEIKLLDITVNQSNATSCLHIEKRFVPGNSYMVNISSQGCSVSIID